MSRLRTLKPGFFLDEDLAECDPLARLLFAGLWTIADREGRLEDRPKRIKVQTLPYDECDVDCLLGQLHRHGLIVRYEVAGARYISVPTWAKHQSPHVKEAPSTIPAPDENGACMVLAPDEPPSSCLGSCLGSGVLEPEKNSSSSDEPDDGFSEFWTAYPRKVGKAEALKRWERMTRKDHSTATRAADHLGRYVASQSVELQFVPHPATFIGPKRKWEDWVDGPPAGYDGTTGRQRHDVCPRCEADMGWDEEGRQKCPVCDYVAASEAVNG